MTRRLISMFLALILCVSLAVSVSADSKAIDFIIDEFDYLTDEETAQLNELGASICEKTGVGIFFVFVDTDSLEGYDVSTIVGGMTDYVIMMENATHWYVHLGGQGDIITLEDEYLLRDIYDETPTYVKGVTEFLEAAGAYFSELPEVTAATEEPIVYGEECFVYDEADLLDDDQEETLAAELEQISHTYEAQLVVVTVEAMTGSDVNAFTKQLYVDRGFGYGENHDGAMLMVCMNPRQYRIYSKGYPGEAIGPDEIDTLSDFMDIYLPKGSYVAAFHSFADQSGEMLEYYQNGSPFRFGRNLAISLVIGILVGVLVAYVLKGQLKSVRKQTNAHVYEKKGSMYVDYKYDIFLYRNVTRTERKKREESKSSGSGGSRESIGGGSF